jgi:hypothetical protein
MARLKEKERQNNELEIKIREVSQKSDEYVKREAVERSKMFAALEKANEEIANLKEQLRGAGVSPFQGKKDKRSSK